LYIEQEIDNDYKDECHVDVEVESPSTQEEIQQESISETQEAQDSLTIEIPRRSKRERKQSDWFSYWPNLHIQRLSVLH